MGVDLSGQKFGKWTVVSLGESYRYPGLTARRWLCRCECGAEKLVLSASLRRGKSTSCGCGRIVKEEEKSLTRLFCDYRKSARTRGHLFELSKEDFRTLVSSPCSYCGREPRDLKSFNGVDRVDNSIGYVSENAVPCCKECNYMKHTADVAEFLAHIERIHSFQHKGRV